MIYGHIDNLPDELALQFRLRYRVDFPWSNFVIIPVKIDGFPEPDSLIEYKDKTYTTLLTDATYIYRRDTLALPSEAKFSGLLYLDLKTSERDLLYTFTGTIELDYLGNSMCKMIDYKVD